MLPSCRAVLGWALGCCVLASSDRNSLNSSLRKEKGLDVVRGGRALAWHTQHHESDPQFHKKNQEGEEEDRKREWGRGERGKEDGGRGREGRGEKEGRREGRGNVDGQRIERRRQHSMEGL